MFGGLDISIVVLVSTIPFFIVFARLLCILPFLRQAKNANDGLISSEMKNGSIMILLGSGGHTGEMIRILEKIDISGFKRYWVVSSGDSTSLIKAKTYELNISNSAKNSNYVTLHRARRVGESLVSSLFNTLKSFGLTFFQLVKLPQFPDILLVNGPGTSVPLAYLLFGLKLVGLSRTKIIYIESLARVNQLSVSGYLLLPISDRFLVQWESLHRKYKRSEYYGILV